MRLFLATALAGLAAAGCGDEEGFPPVARIDLAPAYVAEGDAFATEVRLDGSRSCDAIDHPESCAAEAGDAAPADLRFRWELLDADARLDGASGPVATARVAGDRPVEVRLTVTDADGLSATGRAVIGVTVPEP